MLCDSEMLEDTQMSNVSDGVTNNVKTVPNTKASDDNCALESFYPIFAEESLEGVQLTPVDENDSEYPHYCARQEHLNEHSNVSVFTVKVCFASACRFDVTHEAD